MTANLRETSNNAELKKMYILSKARRDTVRYGTRLGDLKENWFLLFSNLTLNIHTHKRSTMPQHQHQRIPRDQVREVVCPMGGVYREREMLLDILCTRHNILGYTRANVVWY